MTAVIADRETSLVLEVRKENWRIDKDGMLRVTANVLKEGVFPYSADDFVARLPAELQAKLAGRRILREYINLATITEEVLTSLEGKAVMTDDHQWMTVEERKKAERDGKKPIPKEVGSVAGRPYITSDGFVRVDLLIKDKETIDRIMAEELVDISAGYMSNIIPEGGEHDGEGFDIEQIVTRFNHLVLLPAGKGRCGRDVRILNSLNSKGEEMPVTIEKMICNSAERFAFGSEDDLREANRMCDAVAKELTKRCQNAEDELGKAAGQLDAAKKENSDLAEAKAALQQQLEALKVTVDRLMALEAESQQNEEETIIKEELNEEDAKKVTEEVEKQNSLEARRKTIVCAVAKCNSVDGSGWGQEAVDAQFQLLSATARKKAEAREKEGAGRTSRIPNEQLTNQARQNAKDEDRILRRCRARNEKK